MNRKWLTRLVWALYLASLLWDSYLYWEAMRRRKALQRKLRMNSQYGKTGWLYSVASERADWKFRYPQDRVIRIEHWGMDG